MDRPFVEMGTDSLRALGATVQMSIGTNWG
jgi:hypothetical protein